MLRPTLRGARWGLLLGAILSIAYLALIDVLMIMRSGTAGLSEITLLAAGLGVVPSLIIGPLAGFFISLFVIRIAKKRTSALVIGAVVAGFCCLPWLYMVLSGGSFVLFLLPPCVICIFAGIWLGQKVYFERVPPSATKSRRAVPTSEQPIQTRKLVLTGLGVVVAMFVLLSLVQSGIETVRQSEGTVIETYPMQWSSQQNDHCDAYVTLEFVSAPGYKIGTCSKELLSDLESTKTNPVDVEFARTYSREAWEYTVQRVGTWTTRLQYDGLSLDCAGRTACGTEKPPIRAPYRLK